MMGPSPATTRLPVATYDEAKQWLWTYSNPEEWLHDAEAHLPLEAKLVCDMFWLNEAELIRDMRRLWNATLAPTSPPAPPRRRPHYRGR